MRNEYDILLQRNAELAAQAQAQRRKADAANDRVISIESQLLKIQDLYQQKSKEPVQGPSQESSPVAPVPDKPQPNRPTEVKIFTPRQEQDNDISQGSGDKRKPPPRRSQSAPPDLDYE